MKDWREGVLDWKEIDWTQFNPPFRANNEYEKEKPYEQFHRVKVGPTRISNISFDNVDNVITDCSNKNFIIIEQKAIGDSLRMSEFLLYRMFYNATYHTHNFKGFYLLYTLDRDFTKSPFITVNYERVSIEQVMDLYHVFRLEQFKKFDFSYYRNERDFNLNSYSDECKKYVY